MLRTEAEGPQADGNMPGHGHNAVKSPLSAQTTVTYWFKPYFIPQSAAGRSFEDTHTVQQNATSNKAKRKRDQEGQKEPEVWPGSLTDLLDRGAHIWFSTSWQQARKGKHDWLKKERFRGSAPRTGRPAFFFLKKSLS